MRSAVRVWPALPIIFCERRLALALEDGYGRDEETAGADGKQEDGVTIGALGGGWGGGGVVAALGAALSVGGERSEKGGGKDAQPKERYCGVMDCFRVAWGWKLS